MVSSLTWIFSAMSGQIVQQHVFSRYSTPIALLNGGLPDRLSMRGSDKPPQRDACCFFPTLLTSTEVASRVSFDTPAGFEAITYTPPGKTTRRVFDQGADPPT